jgi:hypothetical protein
MPPGTQAPVASLNVALSWVGVLGGGFVQPGHPDGDLM